MTRGWEPAHVAAEADDRRSDDRPDTKDLNQARVRSAHCIGDAPFGSLQLRVEAADVVEGLPGELEPLRLHDRRRRDLLEDRFGLCDNDFFADPARDEFSHQRVQPTTGLRAEPTRVEVRLRQHPGTVAWSSTRTTANDGARSAAI